MSSKVLQELLKQPFGPYLDETVLSKQCKHTSSKRLLLENLMLSYNGKPTGFDRTEFQDPFIPSNAIHLPPIPSGSRVLFRGVLSILALTHLSDKGIQYLDRDFKQRVTGSVLNGIPTAKKYLMFDMKSIFEFKEQKDKQYEVKVLIQGFMGSSASYMRSDIAPDGLLFHTANATKTSFRNFEIVSIDPETYALSRTFLFRYHTLRTMRNILSTYKNGVPTHKRSPQWFLEHYLHGFAYPPHCRWSRINFIEDAESSDEGSINLDNSRPANAQTNRPRHLRIIHQNEVWSVFTSHSEWIFSLVQNHKDLKSYVHGYSWESFLSKVPQLRKKAILDQGTNGRWGLKDEQEVCASSLVDIPVPIPEPNTIPQPSPPQPSPSKKRKHQKKSAPSHPLSPLPKRHQSTSNFPSSSKVTFIDENLDHVYDSDFSQVSTSHHASSNNAALTSLSLHDLLPPEMSTPPVLPVDMLWHCPVGGGTCSYIINLCSPSDDNLRLVPNDSVNYLLNKDWKSNNEQVMVLFYEMVHVHWEDHLKKLDIKYVRHNDANTFEWIHPLRRQRTWPTAKWERRRLQSSDMV